MATAERAYLSPEEFQACSLMPDEDVAALRTQYPQFLPLRLLRRSAKINAILKKRYAAPFANPVPDVVLDWLEAIVTLDCYVRRGFNPEAEQDQIVKAASDTAWAEIQAAANSESGLYELPLLASAAEVSGVSKGGPYGYSEQSPWVGFDLQRDAARTEDERGSGT